LRDEHRARDGPKNSLDGYVVSFPACISRKAAQFTTFTSRAHDGRPKFGRPPAGRRFLRRPDYYPDVDCSTWGIGLADATLEPFPGADSDENGGGSRASRIIYRTVRNALPDWSEIPHRRPNHRINHPRDYLLGARSSFFRRAAPTHANFLRTIPSSYGGNPGAWKIRAEQVYSARNSTSSPTAACGLPYISFDDNFIGKSTRPAEGLGCSIAWIGMAKKRRCATARVSSRCDGDYQTWPAKTHTTNAHLEKMRQGLF